MQSVFVKTPSEVFITNLYLAAPVSLNNFSYHYYY